MEPFPMRILVALLIACFTLACDELGEEIVSSTPEVDLRTTWHADATGTALPGGSAGVTAEDFGAYLDFDVALSGAAPSTTYTWRVLSGTCASPGSQHSSNQAYPNLVTDANGAASVHGTVAGTLDLSGAYVARVSRGSAVVACGALSH